MRCAWADAGADTDDGASCDESPWPSSGSGLSRRGPGGSSGAEPAGSGSSDGRRSREPGAAEPAGGAAQPPAQPPAGQPSGPAARSRRWRLQNRKIFEREEEEEVDTVSDAPAEAPPGVRHEGWAAAAGRSARGLEPRAAGPRQEARPPRDSMESAGQEQQDDPRSEDEPGVQEVTDDELSALLPHIPLGEGGGLTSVGSIKHADGSCKPCTFFYTRLGCEKEIRCEFCHIFHRSKDRRRLGKNKRGRYRELISRAGTSDPNTNEEERSENPPGGASAAP